MECSWKTLLLLVCASLVVQYVALRSFRDSLFGIVMVKIHSLVIVAKTFVPGCESRWRPPCDESWAPPPDGAATGSSSSSSSSSASSGRRHILLFAATRSGSSFTGQLLNQHPDVFYVYEPLFHVWQSFTNASSTCCQRRAPERRELLGAYRDLLLSLYTCQLSFLESYIHPQPQDHVTPALFRRSSSLALCSPPVCPEEEGNAGGGGGGESQAGQPEEAWCHKKCPLLNLTLASEACLRRDYVAIKAVRVPTVGDLRTLSEDPRLDLRIVHLVRDPRAILASRMSVFSGFRAWRIWNATGRQPRYVDLAQIGHTCRDMEASAETGLVSRPPWLRGRYMLLRYEDLAWRPEDKARDMYRFLGLRMEPRVLSWIAQNTNVSALSAASEWHYKYSTARDSRATAESWRLRLNFSIVQAVQSLCNSTLALLGYKQVQSVEELRNLSISLVEHRTFQPGL
ncbi:carbohydrate sulfotransferase 1-like [Engraulis encrasicolus]|uniref:carbohydrate sulfotransferase 1-like n=1 Tax=Engraulis encrasicolus TaxID=184585 RepID=UPI002FD0E92D